MSPRAKAKPPEGNALTAAILRYLRRFPNGTNDLAPLAAEIGVDPLTIQLAVERLHIRRMAIAPFVEPSLAGGAELTQVGSRWLIEYEGGQPADTPVAYQPAAGRVRAADEAARMPRAEVYGIARSGSAG